MKLFFATTLLCFAAFSTPLFSQLSEKDYEQIDSLKQVIDSDVNDTLRVNAYIAWDNMIYFFDPQLDWEINEKVVEICEENLDKELTSKETIYFQERLGYCYNNLGIISTESGNPTKGLEYYNMALEIRKELGFKNAIASSYLNIGGAQSSLGNSAVAIENYYRALKTYNLMLEAAEDSAEIPSIKSGLIDTYNGIGNVQNMLGNFDLALENYHLAHEYCQEINDKRRTASALNNIGIIHGQKEENEKALEYFEASLEIKSELGDLRGVSSAYINIGSVKQTLKLMDEAIESFNKSLEISTEIEDMVGIMNGHLALGKAHNRIDQPDKAISYLNPGLAITLPSLNKSLLKDFHAELNESYRKKGDFRQAYEHIRLFYAYDDSLKNEEEMRAILQQEIKYDYDMKAVQDSVAFSKQQEIDRIEIQRKNAELSAKRNQQYALYGGMALVIVFLIILFKRLKISQEQKRIIEEKNLIVVQKNQEILDSITYAQRIQKAILPPSAEIEKHLKNNFILYQPKDIVAGDFYWMEAQKETVLFAAADCTGHGVPGAMVSVICNGALNRSVREFGLTDPGEILDKTREIVLDEFKKSEDDVKDGMDIALCALNGKKLQYAGAHNPLWIVRKGATEIEEIKANKQPIGKFDFSSNYTTHEIDLNEGDTFYIFSDGFANQFGGESGKKLKTGNFKKLLLSIQDKSIKQQKTFLSDYFKKWKGGFEQLDDVCIVGVKV